MSKREELFKIIPLEEKPKIEKKVYRAKPLSQKILEDFLKSEAKYARIELPKNKNPIAIARGIGRISKRLDCKVTATTSKGDLYLLKEK